ncbi:MAG TPA: gamma-glutamyltransferase family protein [Methylomirabilota bacterium]|jgi:gamma-glutamyltranspeptidase/glutathione hydrolase|nr:gamma-glutamyltransferase family protein [Methylomirabilota bacterium]
MPPHGLAHRPAVGGTRGVVTSAHVLASMAGLEMLLQGGNAVDAAVATAAALNVVEPYMSSLAGCGVMLISSARGRERVALDYTGLTPRAADPTRVRAEELKVGPKAIVTPGNLGGWLAALERFGSMPRARVLAPAIRLAEDGFPLSLKNCEFFQKGEAQLAGSAEGRRLILGNGAPRPGARFVQADLGRTLRDIAEGGAEVLYAGPLGRAIVKAVQDAGGWLSEADLAACRPSWQPPIAGHFRGMELLIPPPPCSGWQLLETLHVLEGVDLKALGHNSGQYLHLFVEAVKLASADRVAYAHPPKPADVPIAGLLSTTYAGRQRERLDWVHAAVSGGERWTRERLPDEILPGHPADFLKEQTTHFAAADPDLTVTVTQSLGSPFGSGFAAPGTGLFLNNFLYWSDLDAESPNYLQPGEQLELMMTPTQGFRNGRCILSIGTPGSFGILQTTPQMILNHLEFGMNIQEAIEAPRVRVYRDRLLDVESRIPEAMRAALAARGHQVNVLHEHGGWSWVVGGAQGLTRDPESGALMGGADPRRDGYAVAI